MNIMDYNIKVLDLCRRAELFQCIVERVLLTDNLIKGRKWLLWNEKAILNKVYQDMPDAIIKLSMDIDYLINKHLLKFKKIGTNLYISLTKIGTRRIVGIDKSIAEMLITTRHTAINDEDIT